MILVEPDQDHIISTEKILATIDQHVDDIALILLPGVQYYTGQVFDIARITEYAHSKGLTIGWDLAHAAGNIPLKLHDWNVDFAAWCTYKYMNAGPGAIAGLFVHQRHGKVEYPEGSDKPVFRHRLTGWYGGDKASRFEMNNSEFMPPDCRSCMSVDIGHSQNSDRFQEQAVFRFQIHQQSISPHYVRHCQFTTRQALKRFEKSR